MVAAPRLVVIGAHEGARLARAARLAAHYGIPRLPAADLLLSRRPLPPGGYVIDSAPQLLDGASGIGGLRPALAFADLVVLLHGADWTGADEARRVLRYYEARGMLADFPPDAPDGDLIVAVDAVLRGRTEDPPDWPAGGP
ncbi:hypothetical protein BX264_5750 [Streptomyces sp. 2333.5]|nr:MULTISPECIES: hypothetical protein [unclassified Streptomyces]PJJ05294.1 hypothetical protein BX264_5750 [Streptomyces sp. 2333.5]SEE72642.1 hypothetical protein SAMN05428943_5851 [Streptomyces sp. 2314.4]SEE97166.1 hypothetical protein SAMN05428942_5848 [Streptomyces sp. 2112.2]SOE10308.1 hypothetical protein SAMN06272775_1363 [Streptomyces sp. 2323.1]